MTSLNIAAEEDSRHSAQNDAALWSRWRLENDESAKLALIRLYQPFARAVAAKLYGKRIHDEIEFDEYHQFATVALIESLGRYQPERDVRFTSFAYPRLTGAILSGLDRLTEKQQQIALRRRLLKDRLSLQDEIEQPAKNNVDQLLGYLAEIGIGLAIGSLLEGTRMVSTDDEWQADLSYERVELKQFAARLRYLLAELTEREQQVIHQHYLQGMSFEEIASGLSLTKGRVSQLHMQGLLRLRKVISMNIKTNVSW